MATALHKISRPYQYLYCVLMVALVAGSCFFLEQYIDYKIVALLLMVVVSLSAMFFDILPVLVCALLSALVWDFFFIPPRFAFRISSTEDIFFLAMYFIIALVNATLTFKIRQAEKLARQQEEKENTLKLYNTLLNSLSHELRTPIATIIGASDNLQTQQDKLSPQNKEQLLAEISKASFRLNQQVENLLNMSRLESGFVQPKKDWCDINELVYEQVKKVENNQVTQKIIININPDIPLFKLDKGMLEQVLYNLISNATLYIPANGTINITAHCHVDVLEIIVEDNGPGFPAGEEEKVFNKFYRLSSKTGGTGLGLSIVKGFVEAQNGSISLEKSSDGGAKFTISIVAETSYLNHLKNE